jgi:phosphoglycolate phosphatase-like HAD superfamily hydrolase
MDSKRNKFFCHQHWFFQLVLDHFAELAKDEIIYVGDAPSDIMASRKVGIPVIAAAYGRWNFCEPGKLY